VQELRKEAGYKLDQKIKLAYKTDDRKLSQIMNNFSKEIIQETLSFKIEDISKKEISTDIKKDVVIGGSKILLGVKG
jgi:hypothetical protein